MGIKRLDCEDLARKDFRDILEDFEGRNKLVILVGENNNILGFGNVENVKDGVVHLNFPETDVNLPFIVAGRAPLNNTTGSITIPEIDFYVSLCCLCSIIVPRNFGDSLEGLAIVLLILGLID
ncbi:hypothetical protein ACFSCX_02745 [Bacillus salitolerans]|uniref:Uncharacterized protein n=1 Tax=Bacillus salitolerans TaxID=1437434 RepID=A0ABW4LK44_9BACI